VREVIEPPRFERVSIDKWPALVDDLEPASLRMALQRSLDYLAKLSAERVVLEAPVSITAERLRDSLLLFQRLLDQGRLDRGTLTRHFDLYTWQGGRRDGHILLTGYYQPILEGRLIPDETYRYPLYSVPGDLVQVHLERFDAERFPGVRLVGRVADRQLVPYFTRAQIDGAGALDSCGCALAWVKDPVEAFMLHVQGSGLIALPDGTFRHIGYAGANGHAYRSIGKWMVQKGMLPAGGVSLQSIRRILAQHPEQRNEILWHNESYVFFRWLEDGPLGSLGVPLTAGRSVATDPRHYPRAAMIFLDADGPRVDLRGQVVGSQAISRWVLSQDAGGAIKGSERADLYCGTGEAAEWVAGRLQHPGRLFVLLAKPNGAKPTNTP